jgi:hypothetical protein
MERGSGRVGMRSCATPTLREGQGNGDDPIRQSQQAGDARQVFVVVDARRVLYRSRAWQTTNRETRSMTLEFKLSGCGRHGLMGPDALSAVSQAGMGPILLARAASQPVLFLRLVPADSSRTDLRWRNGEDRLRNRSSCAPTQRALETLMGVPRGGRHSSHKASGHACASQVGR